MRVLIKTDTEPAIVDLQRAVGASRGGTPTGYDDSQLGDFNRNAKVGRTIREANGLIRTLRADLRHKATSTVALGSNVVPWLLGHAGYIITCFRSQPCGRTALH